MRLPHPRTNSLGFLADSADELIKLLAHDCSDKEKELIHTYFEQGLPPVTSSNALSAMFGYNPGFVWSLLHRTARHYRSFKVPKGAQKRTITAPRVALKTMQKWLSVHWSDKWDAPDAVFGFVSGKSHLHAANRHLGATWVVSVDIENFFPSVKRTKVESALRQLGYKDDFSISAITSLTCFGLGLPQGAPSSPVISNIVLGHLDSKFHTLAASQGCVFTRYADDIVFSGKSGSPQHILELISSALTEDGWNVSERKKRVDQLPGRLKVHGLLVHGDKIRLTKGYRNRLRAYRHLLTKQTLRPTDEPMIKGHLEYAGSVDRFSDQENSSDN